MERSLADEAGQFSWYHTLDLGDGVTTAGMFDHRPHVHHYLLPADLTGLRCIDVGTFDGFWAFEMERRGAREVVALDVESTHDLDWPLSQLATPRTLDETKTARFELAKRAKRSTVQRVLRTVYELDDRLGEFDLVFCGDVLVHLKDPITAVERMRRVCRGHAIICTPISRVRFHERRPLARFDGIDNFEWWTFNQAGLRRLVLAAGFRTAELGRPFDLPAADPGSWKGRRGIVKATV